jgi:hypothetical protein
VCADLLSVDGHARQASLSWCGRFNLGISLIDWLCDEAAVPPSAIAGLPAFAPLTATRRRGPPPTHDAAVFLDALAHELLVELADEVGPPRRREPRSALWPTLRRMLRAELALAGPGYFGPQAPPAALALLRLKSVEPFRIMAERTLAGSSANPRDARQAAQDRARDRRVRLAGRRRGRSPRDLDARHNRFIAAAVAADDASSPPTTTLSTSRSSACSARNARPSACARRQQARSGRRTAPCEPRTRARGQARRRGTRPLGGLGRREAPRRAARPAASRRSSAREQAREGGWSSSSPCASALGSGKAGLVACGRAKRDRRRRGGPKARRRLREPTAACSVSMLKAASPARAPSRGSCAERSASTSGTSSKVPSSNKPIVEEAARHVPRAQA